MDSTGITMDSTGIVILAAGNSSRLGRPKQLLPYNGKTLLSHVITEAIKASLQPVVVVTGAYHEEIEKSLQEQAVSQTYNAAWETGMASGIVAGLEKSLTLHPHLQSIIIAVCDQPHISAGIFQSLQNKYQESKKGIIACRYSETIGTPVLFDRHYFKELSGLSGEAGAKQLLKRYPDDSTTIPFPQGDIDLDTEEDLERLPQT